MRKLLLTSLAAGAILSAGAARADTIFTLGTSNDPVSGPGPYAELTVHLIDSTHAAFTFDRLGAFVFGEMGGNLNATTFAVSPVTFTVAPSSNQTPVFTLTSGNLDGFGNFALDEVSNPNGFSAAIIEGSFTVTNLSGTWANSDAVLTPGNKGQEAAVHAFTANGDSFFAADSSHCTAGQPGCTPPPPPPPPPGIPEPMTLAILGSGLIALGLVRRARS